MKFPGTAADDRTVDTLRRPNLGDEFLEVVDRDPSILTLLVDDRDVVRWASSAASAQLLGLSPSALLGQSFALVGDFTTDLSGDIQGTVTLAVGPDEPGVELWCRLATTTAGSRILRASLPTATKQTSTNRVRLRAHDPLTGLPVQPSVELAPGGEWLVLLVELDGFDGVVARVGPFGADSILRTIADRLQAFFREDDLVVRSGETQFTIIVGNDGGPGWPEAMAERMMLAIGGPIPVTDGLVSISSSIGIVTGRDIEPGDDPYPVAADALERSKASGGGRWTRAGGIRSADV